MEQTITTIQVLNWRKHNTRKDVERPSWFRLENTIMFDRKLFRFDAEQKWVWICILAFASQANLETFNLDLDYFSMHSGVAPNKILETLNKLEENQCVHLITRARDVNVTSACLQTDRQTDRQNAGHVDVPVADAHVKKLNPEDLQEIWNNNSSQLQPKCRRLSNTRRNACIARLKENPEFDYWITIVRAIAVDEFCNGLRGGSGWVADFDYFVGKKAGRFFDHITPQGPLKLVETDLEAQKEQFRKSLLGGAANG